MSLVVATYGGLSISDGKCKNNHIVADDWDQDNFGDILS